MHTYRKKQVWMMIKVLNIIDSLNAGGAESLLKNFLIEAKQYDDFKIDVCLLYSKNIFKEDLEKNNITVFDLDLKFKYDFTGILKIVSLIRKNNYDIVHVHLFPADLFVAIASLFLPKSIKFIFSEHSVYNRRRSLKVYKPIDCFVYSRYDKIICVSNQVKLVLNAYIQGTKNKSVVIKNAIPIDSNFLEIPKIYDVLFVGRLEDAKGVDVLIKAIAILKQKFNLQIKVAILGDGSKRVYLENLSKQLGVDNEIAFLGVQKDVQSFMASSKIFVLPSRWEGLPMVILEAMANRLPIIATPVGGITEIINDGVDGILVEPENPELLADKIYLLLNNENLRLDISRKAFDKVKTEYCISKFTAQMLSLYKENFKSNESYL